MYQFPKFPPAWNSTCFGEFLCPSSGVHSLYTRQWYMSYRCVDSFRAGAFWSCSNAVWHMPLLSVQWINSWWWTEELSKTRGFSWQNKFVKLVHPVGFITKKHRRTLRNSGTPIKRESGAFYPGVKRPDREVDHLTEIKNKGRNTFTSTYAFMTWTGTDLPS
jgi:hypothetical protein